MPFFNRQAEIELNGGIEVLGPALADINGGMGGVYVRSTGVAGKASVKISLPDYGLSSVAEFEVKVKSR